MDEAEKTLASLRKATGLFISEVLNRGFMTYKDSALKEANAKPYDVFRRLDLGKGGYAVAPAKQAKSNVADAIKRKHGHRHYAFKLIT